VGDLIVSNFSGLNEFLFFSSKYIALMTDQIFFLTFYRSLFYGLQLVFSNLFLFNFSIINFNLAEDIFYNFALYMVNITFYSLQFSRKLQRNNSNHKNKISAKIFHKKHKFRFFTFVFFEAMIDSIILQFFECYLIEYTHANGQGNINTLIDYYAINFFVNCIAIVLKLAIT